MANVGSVTKHWITAKEGFVTTTSGSVSSGATTVGLNSVAGYTNGDQVALVIDADDTTKKQVFTGTVDTAGVQITDVVWTEGNDQAHSAGASVVDYETATAWASYAKGLKVEHNQNGTHDNTKVAMLAGTQTFTGNKTFTGTVTVPDATITPAQRTGGFSTGTFTRTTNGTQVVSGVTGFDFVPKLLRFSAVFDATASSSSQAGISQGHYDVASGSNRSVSSAVRADGGAGGYASTTQCIRIITVSSGGIGSVACEGAVTATGSGTFTITFANVNATGTVVIWEAYA